MLKSTAPPQPPSTGTQGAGSPLPPGWTEHPAPTGHTYYYNAETKQSTYTRPAPPPQSFPPHPMTGPAALNGDNPVPLHWQPGWSIGAGFQNQNAFFSHDQGQATRPPRREPQDRPKSKHTIPNCTPWVLVKTRLGRRFVHNPDTRESFWKFPEHLVNAVIEFDIQERRKLERGAAGSPEPVEKRIPDAQAEHLTNAGEGKAEGGVSIVPLQETLENVDEEEGSDEYEEVEVTDDEDEDGGGTSKRLRTEGEGEGEDEDQQVEFDEEDMAYQLAQMGQSYELDPGEYGQEQDYDDEMDEGAEGLPMTQEEIEACFGDLLEDYGMSPYTTWENVVEDGRIIEDPRYTLLPNMRSRKEVFGRWSTARIQTLKDEKDKQAKRDPRIPYLALLQEHATPKLFWPEFKRKYKKEAAMKDMKLSDKEREKLYREHINRISKTPESVLKADFRKLLESIPASAYWNRASSPSGSLPQILQSDVRFISMKPRLRDSELEGFIKTLPDPAEAANGEDEVEAAQRRAERAKRDSALRDRQVRVEEEKRRQQRDLRQGRDELQREEQELQRAMKVNRHGLKDHLGTDQG